MDARDIQLVKTRHICPEQYDAFDLRGRKIAYLHMRHGSFTIECPDAGGELIYSVCLDGDGAFFDYERDGYLSDAKIVIANFYNRNAVWDTPFVPSMLNGNVLISCPEEHLASELMKMLGAYGVKWDMSDRLAFDGGNLWGRYRGRTCYRICEGSMGYCSMDYYESNEEYCDYTKSTFYGTEQESDVEISEEEFEAILLCVKNRK